MSIGIFGERFNQHSVKTMMSQTMPFLCNIVKNPAIYLLKLLIFWLSIFKLLSLFASKEEQSFTQHIADSQMAIESLYSTKSSSFVFYVKFYKSGCD